MLSDDWCDTNISLNKKFYVYDFDLKVSEGVGMVQRKILDQYLTSGKVSTRFS